MIKPKVLFLCTGNSRRTQIAEGFLRAMAGDLFDAASAGNDDTPLDPEAVAVMREVGVDISGQETKAVNRFLGRRFSYVVTLCDREKERTCPIFPGAIWRLQWDLEDPSKAITRDERRAALRVVKGQGNGCCGASALDGCDPITSDLYDAAQSGELPEKAVAASLGCGNPTALAELKAGETVLDLGSGGGIDVLLSAKRVGPTGKAYGLDMTDEMLALAEENKRKSGLANVEFLKGEIEHIPLPENSVDVIISNCVINLSGDKDRVMQEAFRVLKPGGRFAVSDVVVRGEVPAEVRKSMELWVGCIAGALADHEYFGKLSKTGFENIDIEVTRVYGVEDARSFLEGQGLDADALAREVDGKFVSAFVRAIKPAAQCCAPSCCGGSAS